MASSKKKTPSKKPASRSKPIKKKKSTKAQVKKKKQSSPSRKKPSKPAPSTVVPLNPKTLKEMRAPTGKQVFYGIKSKNGKIKPLSLKSPQKFAKKDLSGLNRILKEAKSPNDFVYYEELTREALRDKAGKIQYRKKDGRFLRDKNGKKIPLRKTKVTYAQAKKKQAPILRARGRDIRALDLGFQKRKSHERPTAEHLVYPATQKKPWSQEIVLLGETLKDALRSVHIPMTLKTFNRQAPDGLRVQGRLKVTETGEPLIAIFHLVVETLANFGREVARTIRFKLADQGYRFTSLVKLEELAEENPESAAKIMKVGKDRKSVYKLEPIFSENEFGHPERPQTAKGQPKVSIVLSITAA